jgi:2,4-dienoyl-CoA reductase-like NADH-dependent reductase (Old Yellow Enzyme family)
MEENLAGKEHLPDTALFALYRPWAKGGAGLLISGNVMVDPRAMTGPADVVLDEHQPLAPFHAWADTMRSGGSQAWLQLGHPGRQVYAFLRETAVAPSAVPLNVGKFSTVFAPPRELVPDEITAIIQRFATAAALAEKAGFTGVQIHAAHGYLISQFLSPRTNLRNDAWGGSPARRARFLLDIVRAIRATVSPGFCVAVKLNSKDFQRGGFDLADAAQVIRWLNDLPVDLVELSGGSYENPMAVEVAKAGSILRREAYFLDFARTVAAEARMPLMVTGGIHDVSVAEDVLRPTASGSGIAMVGMATALAFAPDLPSRWLAGEAVKPRLPSAGWRNRSLAAIATAALTKSQIVRLARGQPARSTAWPSVAALLDWLRTRRQARQYVCWMRERRRSKAS